MTKYMDLKEFVDEGFLQEVNRGFFHRLGLALTVFTDDDTGEVKLIGIWDCRDDPEGIIFSNGVLNRAKYEHVKELMHSKIEARDINPDCVDGVQQIRRKE